MKNPLRKVLLMFFSFALVLSSCKWADDVDIYRRVKVEDLPAAITDYVAQNYPNATIRRAWRDNDGYEIRLSNGREINFDLDGGLISDEADNDDYVSVPLSSLPPAITQFLTGNYPGTQLVAAFMDDDEYEVLLASGLEVYFTLNGTFLLSDTNPGYVLVPVNQLPAAIAAYVSAQHPGQTVVVVWMDDDGYEVVLSNGREIYFDLNGNFIAYEDDDDQPSAPGTPGTPGDDDYVPVAINQLPQAILNYVATNYPNLTISHAQMDDDGYEVFLSNGLELNFSLNGTFLYAG